jgi:hypothetical protein
MYKIIIPFVQKIVITVLFLILSTVVCAQSKDSAATSNPLSISGMVDVNFSKNFNNPLSHTNGYRNFDVTENQFDLNLVKVTFQKTASPVGFRIDLAAGHSMDLVNSDASLGAEKSLRNIEQAFLTAVIPVGNGLTINAGKMSTHMGAEVIESSLNINYSRSLLFTYAVPYFHLGAMASYPFSSQLSATFYVYNGWNNIIDNNNDKTLGAEITWNPSPVFSFIQNWIGGPEEHKSTKKRHVFDSIINYQPLDELLFNFNFDYGQEAMNPSGYSIWKGAALIGKYSIGQNSAVALRGEVYDDVSGFTTGITQTLKEITFTYEYKFAGSLITRLEFRRDWSDSPISFEDSNGNLFKNNQNTILIGSIYSF